MEAVMTRKKPKKGEGRRAKDERKRGRRETPTWKCGNCQATRRVDVPSTCECGSCTWTKLDADQEATADTPPAAAAGDGRTAARRSPGARYRPPLASLVNAHGVYTSRLRTVRVPLPKSAKTRATIHLAFDPANKGGEWCYGYDVGSLGFGGGFAPSPRHACGTRESAICAAIDEMRRQYCVDHGGTAAEKSRRGALAAGLDALRAKVNAESGVARLPASADDARTDGRALTIHTAAADAVLDARAVEPLLKTEKQELRHCERLIERGIAQFRDVGAALSEIRDKRLYRESHANFADYCRERWNFDKSYGTRLVAAAEVMRSLESAGAAGKRLAGLITNESQARPLAAIDPADRIEILKAVAKEAGKDAAGNVRATAELIARKTREYVTVPEDLQRRREKGEGRREKGDDGRPLRGQLTMPQILGDPRPFLDALGLGPDSPGAWVLPAIGEAAAGVWNGQRVAYAPVLGSVRRSLEKLNERYEGNSAFRDNLSHLLLSLAREFWHELGIESHATLAPEGDIIQALAGSAEKGTTRRPK